MPAELLESDILAARSPDYDPNTLTALFRRHGILWIGQGAGKIALCPEEDLDLLLADAADATAQSPGPESEPDKAGLEFPDPLGRYPFSALEKNHRTPARGPV